jgi:hypothetical protein
MGTTSKATKIIYWITTVLIALLLMSGIFFLNNPMAAEGVKHLGFTSNWFKYELTIGNFIGGLILLLPFFGRRIKEWAYVAVGIVYISAFIAHLSIDGVGSEATTAVIFFAILLTSYITYHKLKD